MRYLKRMLSLLLSVILLACICAPFGGAVKAQPSDELTFVCDWFNESYTYPFSYSDSYFPEDFSEYDHELAVYSISASMASFTSFDESDTDKNIVDFFEKCGFETESYGYETEGYDTVGLAVGSKEIAFSGEKCTVLMLVIRSGNYGMEWGGNFRLGKGENHLGFDLAKATALGYLNDYAGKHDFSGRVRAVITGYSRGGSIAELMAAELDDGSYASTLGKQDDNIASLGLGAEDICAYAFEPPQCTLSANAEDEVYSNIFNVQNPNDYVPKFVGDIWGFTHFGREVYLPCAENTERYGEYYKNVCAEFDYIMEGTDKTANKCFYSPAMSRSFGSMIDHVMDGFSTDVLKSREYYVGRFESGAVFIAGQYLGKKLGAGDAFKTAGVSLLAALICLTPQNIKMIKSEGYQRYLAQKISDSDAGKGLTKDEVDSLLELLGLFIDYLAENRDEVAALAAQLKNVMYVHQPYVNLAWMRSLDAEDIKEINPPESGELDINCGSLTLRKNAVGKLYAANAAGRVSWSTSDPDVAVVDKKGCVKAVNIGSATVTASLYGADGGIIASDSIEVRVESAFIQMLKSFEKRLFG